VKSGSNAPQAAERPYQKNSGNSIGVRNKHQANKKELSHAAKGIPDEAGVVVRAALRDGSTQNETISHQGLRIITAMPYRMLKEIIP
jgi:hypothetical protein